MVRYSFPVVMVLATGLVPPASASVRTSGHYSIPAEALDGGGAPSGSAHYGHSSSIGGMVGTASSASYSLSSGVLHQTANTPPDVADYAAETAYETPVQIFFAQLLAGVSDADGDTPSIASVIEVSQFGGAVELQASAILYTPAKGFSGGDSFQFSVSDGQGGLVSATVNLQVGGAPGTGDQGANAPTITMEGTTAKIRFRAVPGSGYMLQRSTDGMATWQDVEILTTGPAGIIEWDEPEQPPPPSAFYRFRQP